MIQKYSLREYLGLEEIVGPIFIIRNIHNDRLKQGLIRGIAEFSGIANVLLIAEGIETQEELETVVHLGVQYGQGYFIQRPHEAFLNIRESFLETLKTINFKKNHIHYILDLMKANFWIIRNLIVKIDQV